jgi:predicted transcriptional regulator
MATSVAQDADFLDEVAATCASNITDKKLVLCVFTYDSNAILLDLLSLLANIRRLRYSGSRRKGVSSGLLTNSLVARLNWQERSTSKGPIPRGVEPLMPPKPSTTLTQAELRLMKVLWSRGESTVTDMVAATSPEATLAYTSILTTIRILETKGYVSHRLDGRAFLFSACIGESEARQSEVRHVLQRFFGNSKERLLLSLLGDGEISPEELSHLKEVIANTPDQTGEDS